MESSRAVILELAVFPIGTTKRSTCFCTTNTLTIGTIGTITSIQFTSIAGVHLREV